MKTKDLNYLKASFNEFNGSGYADRSSAINMIDSYIDYSNWRGRFENAELAKEYYDELKRIATHLLETSHPTKTVSPKYMNKFDNFRSTAL